jgi:outer membrane protein assembly factor BamB
MGASIRISMTSRAALVVLLVGGAATATSAAASTRASSGDPDWTVYHGDPAGDGVAAGVASVATGAAAWTSPALDGALYGEPLVSDGRVFVATENDTVYALSVATGAVAWSVHLGTPVPSSALPCGNIAPTVGVTGTPVIDASRSEVFVVADELVNGSPAHELVGLDTATGKTELTQNVDPPDSTPSALLQRTGLTLDAGRVVFGYGGNYGDCGSYHGWVASVPEAGGAATDFAVDGGSGESQGAIWMGGAAPVLDAKGDVWVTAGNGSVYSSSHAYDDSDSVLELSPSLSLLQYFAPSNWASNNARDLDLSTAPALLSDGQVVAAGKTRAAYLLNGASLGGIGGQEATLAGACAQDIDGGVAFIDTTVYLPCYSGVIAVQVSGTPGSIRLLWSSGTGGGPPILAAGLVWTVGQDGTLYGLNPTTGSVQAQAAVGAPANHFPTPGVGSGYLLVPAATRIVAFRAPPVAPATTTTTATTTSTTAAAPSTTSTQAVATSVHHGGSSGSDTGVIVAVVLGALALGAAASALAVRARRRRARSQ